MAADKGKLAAVHDGRDEVERFDDGALARVILADHDSAGLNVTV